MKVWCRSGPATWISTQEWAMHWKHLTNKNGELMWLTQKNLDMYSYPPFLGGTYLLLLGLCILSRPSSFIPKRSVRAVLIKPCGSPIWRHIHLANSFHLGMQIIPFLLLTMRICITHIIFTSQIPKVMAWKMYFRLHIFQNRKKFFFSPLLPTKSELRETHSLFWSFQISNKKLPWLPIP